MLTQFGKTWVDTDKICSVREQEWEAAGLHGTKFQIWIGAAYDEISDIADPEGFKGFKEWLKYQSADEAIQARDWLRQCEVDHYVQGKMIESAKRGL